MTSWGLLRRRSPAMHAKQAEKDPCIVGKPWALDPRQRPHRRALPECRDQLRIRYGLPFQTTISVLILWSSSVPRPVAFVTCSRSCGDAVEFFFAYPGSCTATRTCSVAYWPAKLLRFSRSLTSPTSEVGLWRKQHNLRLTWHTLVRALDMDASCPSLNQGSREAKDWHELFTDARRLLNLENHGPIQNKLAASQLQYTPCCSLRWTFDPTRSAKKDPDLRGQGSDPPSQRVSNRHPMFCREPEIHIQVSRVSRKTIGPYRRDGDYECPS